jgi:hypothetical protein
MVRGDSKPDIDPQKEALARANKNLALATGELLEEQHALKTQQAEQAEREKNLAKCFQMIGQHKAMNAVVEFGNVSSLIWLKEMKEAKLYRDLPGIGTWDKYCEAAGLCRRKVDEDLLNLSALGQQFLETVSNLRVGYRDLRKLRQLTHDGAVVIEGECLRIGEEAIPINEDHAEDLQAAIEKIIEDKDSIKKRLSRLEKDFKGAVKEETEGFDLKEKNYLKRIKELEKYEPDEKDREWSVKQMETVEETAAAFQIAVSKLVVDPRLKEDRHLQAKIHGHLHEAWLSLQDLRTRLDDVIDMFNE